MTSTEIGSMIVGLDIGTSKVVAIVGEIDRNGLIKIIGIGSYISTGLKRGMVINIEATIHAIQQAIKEAELMAGCKIYSVHVGIAGSHVKSLNSNGIVAIKDRNVSREDVARVIDAAKAVAMPADQKLLHTIAQEFVIDNQDDIKHPIGMSGVRLEAKVHLVTCAINAEQNIRTCINSCNLQVDDIALEQLASSQSVLSEDEKQLGVCLVDIGGGTTDIAIFTGGTIRYTSMIPVAGNHVTNDISLAFHTPTRYAEELKIKYACATKDLVGKDQSIKVSYVGDRPPKQFSRHWLAEIVEARYEEIFRLIKYEIHSSGFKDSIPAGVVITGGTSKIEGAINLAEKIFGTPVRLGIPKYISGFVDVVSSPIYSTGVGLLLYAQKKQKYGLALKKNITKKISVSRRITKWFQGNF